MKRPEKRATIARFLLSWYLGLDKRRMNGLFYPIAEADKGADALVDSLRRADQAEEKTDARQLEFDF